MGEGPITMHVKHFSNLKRPIKIEGGYLRFRRIFLYFDIGALGTSQEPENGELFFAYSHSEPRQVSVPRDIP